MKNWRMMSAMVVLAVVAMLPANAQIPVTITQTQTFSGVADPAIVPITFDKFDPTLGTLLSVEIELTGLSFTGSASVTNNNSTTKNYSITINADYSITDPNGNIVESIFSSPTYSSPVVAHGTFTTPVTTTNAPSPTSTVYTDSPTLTLYTGVGGSTITLDLGTNDFDTVAGVNFTETHTTTGAGTVNLIYTYVPEPSQTVAWTLGLGLLLVVGSRRLLRSSSVA